MNVAFIGIGTNVEPRERYMKQALEKLSQHGEINLEKQSSIYDTPPVGYEDQNSFLNMAVEVKTSLANTELLEACQQIEKDLGREPTFKNGPREIDLDILLYNHEYRELEELQLPHPRMHERAFVLVPLCEIAPEQVIPTSGRTVEELLRDCPTKDVKGVMRYDNLKQI